MEKLANALFSMRGMALGMLVFLVAIAKATFIESSEGVQAAKLWVYNAGWFQILLLFLSINLIANIVRYKMWKREKIAVLSFHISFLVIILGAGVTRYFSFEGVMKIREGANSNIVFSNDPFVRVVVNDGVMQYSEEQLAYLAEGKWTNRLCNRVNIDFEFPKHKTPISIEFVDFKSKLIDTIELNKKYTTSALDIVTDGMKSNYVINNEVMQIGSIDIAFKKSMVNGANVYRKNDTLMIRPSMPMRYIPMKQMQAIRQSGGNAPDSAFINVAPGEEVPFATTTLYQFGEEQFVFKQELPNVARKRISSGTNEGTDYLTLRVSDGEKSKIVTVKGGYKEYPTPEFFEFNGLNYQIDYGVRRITLPFYMKCIDFTMMRYPGSEVASSFSSDLQVLDTANNYFKQKHVFMNHVLDYNGYRFFQSAYDPDEKGTILSVNHDYWGTNISYLGYLIMAIGMILSLFSPSGRFRELLNKLGKRSATVLVLCFFFFQFSANAQNDTIDHSDHAGHNHEQEVPREKPSITYITEEHSEEVARLLVQDYDGRIVPLHTVCDELLRKLYRSNTYKGHNAVQTIMSIQLNRDAWFNTKIIQVPSAVQEELGLGKYCSIRELTKEDGTFRWIEDYNRSMQKRATEQGEFDKKLIKLVEKQQVFFGIIQWQYMRILPIKNSPKNLWDNPFTDAAMESDTLGAITGGRYVISLLNAKNSGNYNASDSVLTILKDIQRDLTANVPYDIPSETAVNIEISYNKMNIFHNAGTLYITIGFIMMVMYYLRILRAKEEGKAGKITRKILVALLWVTFLYHGTGLGLRWYISGHVPWGNGYEALLYIAWILALAGFIFSRFHKAVLPATAILTYCIIFVTELNLLDPEITPLQPVLKSYWLMIHVAIITASYAFLGLACILGINNLFLYIARNRSKNQQDISRSITELTYVSELTMTIGVFLLTIGTFLGGVWANESWGRYWGWDSKETWALVSVLVYAIILHFKYIPALKGKFAFNVASVWGYAAILFTFFGVNFILVGLHSYAQGDGAVSLPPSVWIIGSGFLILTIVAGFSNRAFTKKQRLEL